MRWRSLPAFVLPLFQLTASIADAAWLRRRCLHGVTWAFTWPRTIFVQKQLFRRFHHQQYTATQTQPSCDQPPQSLGVVGAVEDKTWSFKDLTIGETLFRRMCSCMLNNNYNQQQLRWVFDHRYAGVFTYLGLSGPNSQAPTNLGRHLHTSPLPSPTNDTPASHPKTLPKGWWCSDEPRTSPCCGFCRKSTTTKAEICCSSHKSIHQGCSAMTRAMWKQWRQTNDHQCPKCRSVHNSKILCSICGNWFRLKYNKATSGVSDATAHLQCTALNCRLRDVWREI